MRDIKGRVEAGKTHTWEIYLHYYRCPNCGYVLEDRNSFEQRGKVFEKTLLCPRCETKWREETSLKPRNGEIEVNWE